MMMFIETVGFVSTFCYRLFRATFELLSQLTSPNLMFAFDSLCVAYIKAHFDKFFDALQSIVVEEITPPCSLDFVELCDSCTSSI